MASPSGALHPRCTIGHVFQQVKDFSHLPQPLVVSQTDLAQYRVRDKMVTTASAEILILSCYGGSHRLPTPPHIDAPDLRCATSTPLDSVANHAGATITTGYRTLACYNLWGGDAYEVHRCILLSASAMPQSLKWWSF
jgi:hypothetical protein